MKFKNQICGVEIAEGMLRSAGVAVQGLRSVGVGECEGCRLRGLRCVMITACEGCRV